MKKFILSCVFVFFLIFISQALNANQDSGHKTICLNMIVKDESKVIKRCLSSVKNIIDYWVIVDTGSSDGTQQIIKDFMKDKPGELHERPWVNFGYNRDEALKLVKNKGDYVLFIDADEILAFADNFKMPHLDKDCYMIEVKEPSGTIFKRMFLINNSLNWKWEGVLHENVSCQEAQSSDVMNNVMNITMNDGHRSEDPQKFLKDAQTLEKALQTDPENSRMIFYVAQAYFNAKEFLQAIKFFEKRVAMGGWDQEVFWALYMIARAHDELNSPQDLVIDSYCKAFNARPSRADPLYYLGRYYNKTKNPTLAYLILTYAATIPASNDGIFVEKWINEYGIQFEICNSYFCMGKYQESYDGYQKILSMKDLPLDVKKTAEDNFKLIVEKIYSSGIGK